MICEKFLKVNVCPSYRLVSPEGNLIDAEVDARNLEGIMQLFNGIGLYH